MRSVLRSTISLIYKLVLFLTIVSAVVWGGSFLVEYHAAVPWPEWLTFFAGQNEPGTYLKIDVNDGQFAIAQIRPMEEDQAYTQGLNPFPLGGYSAWHFGIIPVDGIWFPLGAAGLWGTVINPWPGVLALGVLALLTGWAKRAYGRWMTVQQRSRVCLHCGATFGETGGNTGGETCAECGAGRPMVTVSSS